MVKRQANLLFLTLFVALLIVARIVAGYMYEPIMYGKADFTVLYVAADFALDNQSVYANEVMYDRITELRGAKGAVRYLYPPTALLVFIPLQVLPYTVAVWVWLSLSIGLLIGSIYLLQSLLNKSWTSKDLLIIAVTVVLFAPLFTTLRSGQVNILLMFLFVLQLVLFKKKQYVWTGAILAGMVLIKLFPIALIVYYLVKKQYKVVGYAVISICIFLAISVMMFGVQSHITYVQKIPERTLHGIHPEGITRHNNMTLNAVIQRMYLLNEKTNPFAQENSTATAQAVHQLRERIEKTKVYISEADMLQAKVIHYSIIIPLLLALLVFTWRSTSISRETLLVEQSLWLSVVLFAAKDAHSEYLVLLLPVVIWFMVKRDALRFMVAGCLALLAISEMILLPYVPAPDWLYILPLSFLVNTIVLLILIRVLAKSRGQ